MGLELIGIIGAMNITRIIILCVCVSLCVYLKERERYRERESLRERLRERATTKHMVPNGVCKHS